MRKFLCENEKWALQKCISRPNEILKITLLIIVSFYSVIKAYAT